MPRRGRESAEAVSNPPDEAEGDEDLDDESPKSNAEEGPSEPEAEEPLAPSAVETVDNEASADLHGTQTKWECHMGIIYSRH